MTVAKNYTDPTTIRVSTNTILYSNVAYITDIQAQSYQINRVFHDNIWDGSRRVSSDLSPDVNMAKSYNPDAHTTSVRCALILSTYPSIYKTSLGAMAGSKYPTPREYPAIFMSKIN